MQRGAHVWCRRQPRAGSPYHLIKVAFLLQQILRRALLHHLALVDDDNAVGREDGAQAVRNHNGRAPLGGAIQRLFDNGLGLVVQGRGGLVQQENFGALDQSARDGDPLALCGEKQTRREGVASKMVEECIQCRP